MCRHTQDPEEKWIRLCLVVVAWCFLAIAANGGFIEKAKIAAWQIGGIGWLFLAYRR